MSDSSAKNAAVRYELVAEAVQDPGTADPIVVVRKALRGRLGRAALLATLFAAAGAILGYVAVPPVFESTGLVRIAASLPAVLYEETNAQFNEPFEAFAESQATQITSRDVLKAAVDNPQLQELGWPSGDVGVQQIEDSLSVVRERGHQFIQVSVEHNQPEIAQAAVNAVLIAYAEQFNSTTSLSPSDIEQLLIAREAELDQQLQTLRKQMLAESDQYGLDAIRNLRQEKVDQLTTIDQKLSEIDRAIAAVGQSLDNGTDDSASAAMVDTLTSIGGGVLDSRSTLLQREQTLSAEIETWKKRYGPNHPMLREFNRQLDVVRLRLQMLNSPQAVALNSDAASSNSHQATLNYLLNLERTYINMRADVLADAERLGAKFATLTGINEHISEVQQRLTDTRRRLDEIQVEISRPSSSRVAITSMGEFPLSPIKDRRKGLAAASGLFGMLLGTGVVVFVGLIDRRCRFVDQVAQCAAGAPVLCRLPELNGNNDGDLARATVAVHQLRHSLQISHEDDPGKVITVTSCCPGEGKTSLALALASSFAGSGSRTLLIDADPRNSALSRQLGIERMPGLYDAVRSENGSGEIVRTDSQNLWVMATGAIDAAQPAQLSQQNLRWLLDAVAERFDSIIIDTGPVTSSVEASASCAVADFVLLMVAREQTSSMVRDALDRAQQCTIGRVGLVFNRALSNDVRGIDDDAPPQRRDITALVPGAIPQPGPTVGKINPPRTTAAETPSQMSRAA